MTEFLFQYSFLSFILLSQGGRDSSVGIVTRYGLDGPGIESRWGVRFSVPVQNGPGDHPTSYTRGTVSFPVVKRPGRGVDHPPISSAEVERRVVLYTLYLYLSFYHNLPCHVSHLFYNTRWIILKEFCNVVTYYCPNNTVMTHSRSQWPSGLRRKSSAASLLRLWVRIPPAA